MTVLTRFAHSRISWLVLGGTALCLEAAALYFQYVMKLDPCVMCIYQRLAVFGIFAAGIIGIMAPQYLIVRILAALGWAVSATWGLKLALALVDMQNNPSPFSTCSFLPDFPAWMPLHEWFPAVMLPTGMCTDVPWQFMGVTMAEWMVVAFSGFLVVWLLFIVPILSGSTKPSLYK
ncbi:disulfide bond formation protein DsbB [Shewanella sp. HN-41]|uniref:disulfide bond formation protein DsbB n=1 Tax=Shewanella sp. HN-41 TaxID=327275 RepID=UPI000212697B|nr:disulfide bond formation protein DsbB [Shewanella sp. HN-41]EGM69603.1 periplasmic thiol:disulfide oxidoreductase DsbB, required for DsbA reoxidation [Shewanella sp. HN-41]